LWRGKPKPYRNNFLQTHCFPIGKFIPLKDIRMKAHFEIELLPDAVQFLDHLDEKTRDKIYYNIRKSQFVNDNELFKKLNDFIWEFRTLYNGKAYRLFAFWDKMDGKETLVVATQGILKKTQKTPTKDIKKAEEIRRQYLNQNAKGK
jgi:phage-related protein